MAKKASVPVCVHFDHGLTFEKCMEALQLGYSSVMGCGKAQIVEDVEEKIKAMVALMKTQTQKDFEFNERLVSIVSVIRLDVSEYTAKHRPIPENLR